MINLYETVTERILAQLEKGLIPWRKEWKASGPSSLPFNYQSERPYRGINVLLLLCSGYSDPRWLTYKQAQSIGAQVRKGEKGTPIVFWSMFAGQKTNTKTGDAEERMIPFARQYTVFNIDQCTGIPADLPIENPATFEPIPAAQRIADEYLTRAAIELRHGGDRAYYHPRLDFIQMPIPAAFVTPESYYSTLFHEAGHSTGHASRLDRDFKGGTTFGDCDYSKEELVAEFTAAFLCGEVGLSNERVELNHVAYIQGWMKALKNDKKMLMSAAQKAQRAADLVMNRSMAQAAESQPEQAAA